MCCDARSALNDGWRTSCWTNLTPCGPRRSNCRGRRTLDEQQVVGEAVAVRHLELADGDTAPGGEVQLVSVLDEPPGGVQGLVKLDAGLLLW